MDSTLDNSKINESDNSTQALISNANTDINIKPDDGNIIFETDEQLNDGLNNVIELTKESNVLAGFTKDMERNKNLILPEDNAISSNLERNLYENVGDMGPETCVDIIDDVDHEIDLLECSTLSHSKETLPSSDNPSDNKFSSQEFDMFDSHNIQDKSVSPTSPSNQHQSTMSGECKQLDMNPFMDNRIEQEDKTDCEMMSQIRGKISNDNTIFSKPISDQISATLVDANNFTESIIEVAKEVELGEQKIKESISNAMIDLQTEPTQLLLDSLSVDDPALLLSGTQCDTISDNTLNINETTLYRKPEVIEFNAHDTNKQVGNIDFEEFENITELPSIAINKSSSIQHNEYCVKEEPKPEEIIPMQVTVHNVSTDDDDNNKSKLDFESYNKEQIQNDITSSDITEQNVEQDNNIKKDQMGWNLTEKQGKSNISATSDISAKDADLDKAVDEIEKQSNLRDIFPHKTEEFDSTTHESCDESADEWNYTKSKSDIIKEDDSEKIQLEENENNESQESEELIKKEQEEKASVTSPVEHSEHFAKKYSESLDQEVEDMTSQLNPDAKEFIPTTSPVSFDTSKSPVLPVSSCSNGDNVVSQSPQKVAIVKEDELVSNDNESIAEISIRPSELEPSSTEIQRLIHDEMRSNLVTQFSHCLNGDEVVAQSPRKGAISMDDIEMPSEKDFHSEIANRPSEIEIDASEPFPELNLKEAMHGSEKEEQSSPDKQYGNSTFESADMRTSIYVDNTIGKMEDVMNKIQELPNDIDDSNDTEKLQNIGNESTIPLVILSANEPPLVQTNMNGESPISFNINKIADASNEDLIKKKSVENKLNKVSDVKKIDPKAKTLTGPKKLVSSTSVTLSDNAKPKAAQTASKTKVGAAARPRTAPVSSSKPPFAEGKSSANATSARAKIESKVAPVTGIKKMPISKPKAEELKTSVRQPPSKVGSSIKSTSRTASTTSTATTKRAPISASSSSTKTLGQRPTLSPNAKTAPISATSKPTTSPRSTVTSTLRKTEAVKSHTGTKVTSVRTTTTTAKPLEAVRHKTSAAVTTVRKMPTTASTKAVLNKTSAISKTSTAIKKSTNSTTIKQNLVASEKADVCEINVNGSSL